MTRIPYAALALCTIGAVACETTTPDPQTGPTKTITLEADDNGDFEFCDDGGDCQTLPNPNDCARLVIDIDTASGATCETCYAADGTELSDTCEETSVACDVVTIPEPDCVVCAYVNGAIIYSSCIAEEPTQCVVRESFPPCEVCYGPNGNIVSDSCHNDCSEVLCAAVLCAPGYESVTMPGDCCPICVPVGHCDDVDCPDFEGVPECPPGQVVARDPTDCCGYICEPAECSEMLACPAIAQICPEGEELDFSPPHCCGACVPAPSFCTSDHECREDEFCAIEACAASNSSEPSGANGDSASECFGACRKHNQTCANIALPDPSACSGEWKDGGFDQFGCPLPPVCVCANGSVSSDGDCVDSCEQIACFWSPECHEGQRLEIYPPYCCGICVDDVPACYSSQDCHEGSICTTELGECSSSPSCNEPGTVCPDVCTGKCVARE